jgi:Putative beta-barrel porin 2
MKKAMASAGLLALGAVGAETAHGQLMAGAEKPWSVNGTLNGFYDDNYNTAPDGPFRRGSFGYEIRPAVAFNMPLQQTSISASYIFDDKWYADRPVNKSDFSHDFELLLVHNFSQRYTLDVSESFVIGQEPALLDPVNSLPLRSNGDNIRNDGAINLHATITPLLGLVLGYDNTFYHYQQSGPASYSAELDRMEQLVIFDTRWQIFSQTTGVVGYRYGHISYDSTENLNPFAVTSGPFYLNPNTRNANSDSIYIGADHTFRRDLSGTLRVGAQYVDYYNDPSIQNSWSPYVDLSLTYTYMSGGTLTFGFHDAHNQTDQTGALVPGGVGFVTTGSLTQDQESQVVYGTVIQKITPKLIGTLTGQFQNSTYNGGVLNNEVDRFYLLGLNLTYQFTHYISGQIGYNYDYLQSDIPLRGYNRNRVYVGATASY